MTAGRRLRALIERLIHSGAARDETDSASRRIVMANSLALAFGCIALAYAAVLPFFVGASLDLANLLAALLFFSVPVANHAGRHRLASLLTNVGANLIVAFDSLVLDGPTPVHLLFFPAVGVPLLLFRKDERRSIVVCTALPVALYGVHHVFRDALASTFGHPSLPEAVNESLVYVVFAVTFLVVHCLFQATASTERTLQETIRDLALSEERFRVTVETASLGIVGFDFEGRFVAVNPAFAAMIGWDREELMGRTIWDCLPAEEQAVSRERLRRLAERTDPLPQAERRFLRRDGQLIDVSNSSAVYRTPDGQAAFIVSTIEDITERKESERVIAEQQSKLTAAAKMSVLGEMAGGIAHEVNNPLAIIGGRIEQLRRLLAAEPLSRTEAETCLESIARTSQRIARIVKGLQTFARQSDRDPFTSERLSAVLDDTLGLCRDKFLMGNVELRFERPSDAFLLECRPAEVSQVVLNLLSNAFDAVGSLPERWVALTFEDLGPSYRLSVTDSGHGIAPEIATRMLEPFFTTKEVGRGTGLGLSISKGICEAHGGSLAYDPTSLRTRFVVTLPKIQTDTSTLSAAA